MLDYFSYTDMEIEAFKSIMRLERGFRTIVSACTGDVRHLLALVRATAVGRDAERNVVLAGDPKRIRLLCNTTLITDIPSRGSKEERIRIHLQVWANIRNTGYKR